MVVPPQSLFALPLRYLSAGRNPFALPLRFLSAGHNPFVPPLRYLSAWLFPLALLAMSVSSTKTELRRRLRAERRAFADALPGQVRALVLHRPPLSVLELVPVGKRIGLYHAAPGEAPAGGYARFFSERGHAIALPWFASRTSRLTGPTCAP